MELTMAQPINHRMIKLYPKTCCWGNRETEKEARSELTKLKRQFIKKKEQKWESRVTIDTKRKLKFKFECLERQRETRDAMKKTIEICEDMD